MALTPMRLGALFIETGLAVGALANAAQTGTPPSTTGEELITWLIRGSISGAMLLLVWLFNRAVVILDRLAASADDHGDRLTRIETELGMEPRKENRGVAARRGLFGRGNHIQERGD